MGWTFSWLEAWKKRRLDAQALRLPPPVPVGPVTVPQVRPPRWRPRAPKEVPFQQSPNYLGRGNAARNIELVIMHCTAGSFASAVQWLLNGDRENPTSAHYVVAKDGRVIQLVAENDIAYHAGYGAWKGKASINSRSVGIELENNPGKDGKSGDPYPDPQMEAALWLVVRTCQRHGLGPEAVLGHADVDPIRRPHDPGPAFPMAEFRYAVAVALKAAPGGTAP